MFCPRLWGSARLAPGRGPGEHLPGGPGGFQGQHREGGVGGSEAPLQKDSLALSPTSGHYLL